MIIVTGGAGFIGSNLIKALNEKGITNILVVDNLKNSYKIKNLVDLKISDFLDKKDFLIEIKSGKSFGYTEAIFHEGACSITTLRDGKYMMSNNYQYSKELLHYCLNRSIPLLYASSAAVYGNSNDLGFFESSECEKPLNVYAYSKFLFDEYVRQFLSGRQSQIVGFRYFNVYGPREEHKGNMASIAFRLNENLKNGKSLKLFEGSKNYKRDFVFISDVVEANLWFLENGISGIFNLGTGHAESFQDLAENILGFYKRGAIEYIPFPQKLKSFYQKFTKANLKNLRAAGYKKPFKTLNEGIKEYLNWLNQ